MPINRLTKEVDVYCRWIDEAEKLTKEKKQGKSLGLMNNAEEEDVKRPSLYKNGSVPLRSSKEREREEAKSEDDNDD